MGKKYSVREDAVGEGFFLFRIAQIRFEVFGTKDESHSTFRWRAPISIVQSRLSACVLARNLVA